MGKRRVRFGDTGLKFHTYTSSHRPDLAMVHPYKRPPFGRYYGANIVQSNGSLTELIALTAISASSAELGSSIRVASPFSEFALVKKHHPWDRLDPMGDGINLVKAMRYWEHGGGHVIQRMQRLVGLPVDPVPRGRLLNFQTLEPQLVVIHTSIRSWGFGCSKKVLHPWVIEQIKKLVEARRDLKFIQTGPKKLDLGCSYTCPDLAGYFELIGKCGTFIGLPSGLMHLATAYRKRVICVYEFIHPNEFRLPMNRKMGPEALLWFYPQNIHFHAHIARSGEKRLSVYSLIDALEDKIDPDLQLDARKA